MSDLQRKSLLSPIKSNQSVNSLFGLSLLAFKDKGKTGTYIDKTGTLDPNIYSTLSSRFPSVGWTLSDNTKSFVGFSNDEVQKICRGSSHCFFPSTRREMPHWLNLAAVDERKDREPNLDVQMSFSTQLNKPLYVERSREKNKQWILDVMFDSRPDLEFNAQGQLQSAPYDNLGDRLFLRVARENVNKILQAVLNDSSLRIHANYRTLGTRLAVAREAAIVIPTLDGLSLGQSLLFNMFCTIARYADVYDLRKGHNLAEVEGIAIIDEIDAHLHTELQYATLPKLIKLFPRVQFIISTHAPMFLLGMDKEFSVVINSVLPSG